MKNVKKKSEIKEISVTGLTKEDLDKVTAGKLLLISQDYFENMNKSFEQLILALTSNSPGNVPRAIGNLEYLRRGFNLKYAKEHSERNKEILLLTHEQILKSAESAVKRLGNDGN